MTRSRSGGSIGAHGADRSGGSRRIAELTSAEVEPPNGRAPVTIS